MYYLSTVKMQKVSEDGTLKPVSEKYLVDAVSYTDAEERVITELTPFAASELDVTDLHRQNVADILTSDDSDADKWYLAKVGLITIDEKTAKEKRVACRMYIQSSSFKSAYDTLQSHMHSSVSDYVILSIIETPVLDYFPDKA